MEERKVILKLDENYLASDANRCRQTETETETETAGCPAYVDSFAIDTGSIRHDLACFGLFLVAFLSITPEHGRT